MKKDRIVDRRKKSLRHKNKNPHNTHEIVALNPL